MTNEELKKKICEIIAPYVSAWGEDERIADAIIDVLKDEQQSMNGILTNMSSYMNYKLHELEHRAARAERALKSAINDDTCCFCNMNAPCKVGRDWGSSECIQSLLQQAEKELAEEGKDEGEN